MFFDVVLFQRLVSYAARLHAYASDKMVALYNVVQDLDIPEMGR